jgi:hypothetical protein
MFEFVGRLMGVAIRTNTALSLDLPSIGTALFSSSTCL